MFRVLALFALTFVLLLSSMETGFAAESAAAGRKKPAAKKKPAKPPRPERIQPNWIWLNTKDDEPEKTVYFRREFQLRGDIAAARLYATCDDVMTVFLDGEKVMESGNWEKPLFKDVAKQANRKTAGGRHVIAVEAKNGKSAAGLVLRLDFESGWRDAWSIVTDNSWQVSTKPAKGWKNAGFKGTGWKKPEIVAALGKGPWARSVTAATFAAAAPLRDPTATPVDQLKVKKDFKVELLYSVPKATQGSWVNMCVDPKGRLIVSDQYGSLYRVTVSGDEPQIEKLNVDIGEAQGLLWAFDSLYVNVNKGQKYEGGLYRVLDTTGDGELDTVKQLRSLKGTGEHGPHAVLPHPDGKSLYVVCGNRTELTEIDTSRVPRTWDEDNLLPRVQGRFMRGVQAPGGYICRIDPEGKNWELVSTGFRNQFDAAINREGELFTYDADMEWDMNTPWYRPTRVCHVVSGSEFGWRSGGGKWPVYYEDSVPPVVNIGPGSPTGICFGYGAAFPEKYQNALFISDWSYGKMYAVHLKPNGATYSADLEEFITGTPLPLTDVVINPHDGAMYFLIGGRRVQSGLYRVTYPGAVATDPTREIVPKKDADLRKLRRSLEELHLGDHPDAVEKAWPYLGHDDRFIRYAARIAIEHRPRSEWQDRALAESNPQAALTALMALARTAKRAHIDEPPNIDSPLPSWSAASPPGISIDDARLRRQILEALDAHTSWAEMSVPQKLTALRVMTLAFLRIAPPDDEERAELLKRGQHAFPAKAREINSELAALLVYLQDPTAAERIVPLLEAAPTQEEQIDLAKTLRHLHVGWTPELQKRYFEWFVKASGYRGGASFATFVQNIRSDAIAGLSNEEKETLKPVLEAKLENQANVISIKPRPFVRKWSMQELVPLVQNGLKNRDFDRGRKMFAAANCFACHRFDNQGGAVGPDLTSLAGRFSSRDILESVVEPNKQISDQYAAVQIITLNGKVINGRIVNLAGDSLRVMTNMLDPNALERVDRKQIDMIMPSKVSMMPAGLLDTLHEDELLDLMAYLLSRGDRNHALFKP